MVHKCTHLEQIPLNGLEIIGPFCWFVYFFLCKRLQLLSYSYCGNRVKYGKLDIFSYVFTCLTTDPYRLSSGSKRYRPENTSSLDEFPASWRSETAYSKSKMRLMAYARQGLNSRKRFRDRSWRSIISGPLSHQSNARKLPRKTQTQCGYEIRWGPKAKTENPSGTSETMPRSGTTNRPPVRIEVSQLATSRNSRK